MGTTCLFVSDLHGQPSRYDTLFDVIRADQPDAVFFGGDLLPRPHPGRGTPATSGVVSPFVSDVLAPGCLRLREQLGHRAPAVFVIPGNDDPRVEEPALLAGARRGLWRYVSASRVEWREWVVYGYPYVPPTPFLLKDWERYDVSRYVDPGCISPEEGWRTTAADPHETRMATIEDDLARLALDDQPRAIWLMHSPPYDTPLDRAALDGKVVEHVPVDVHVGSIAIRRFIESREPLLTLHGHVHEAARLTGTWRTRIGRTHAFQGAHDGPELAVVRFDPERLDSAERLLLTASHVADRRRS